MGTLRFKLPEADTVSAASETRTAALQRTRLEPPTTAVAILHA